MIHGESPRVDVYGAVGIHGVSLMQVQETGLPGVLIVELDVFDDRRGLFAETYHKQRYAAAGIAVDFVQDNFSRSSRGTVRGLHYQIEHAQGKLVQVIAGEVVDVADGFARNYLLPQKYAIKANDGALEAAESIRETRLAAERKAKNLAEAIATQLVGSRVVLAAQAGDEGQLYGSVSVADVVEGIRRFTGIELDKSQVEMDESIKAIGLHEIQIKVHTEVEFPLTLDIIPA